MSEHVMIMTTLDSERAAQELGSALVRELLVACAQRLRIDSTYEWEGEIRDEPEFLVLLKTTAAKQGAAMEAVARLHTYDEPEIVALPIVDGSPGYLAWLTRITG